MDTTSLNIGKNVNQLQDANNGAIVKDKKSESAKLKKACQDFEAIFTYYLFKNMRQTVDNSGGLNKFTGKDTYNMIMDQKIAEDLAKRGNGLGIQKILFEQLTKKLAKEVPKEKVK
jgi:peptidoglycan hydrolase FlgJ